MGSPRGGEYSRACRAFGGVVASLPLRWSLRSHGEKRVRVVPAREPWPSSRGLPGPWTRGSRRRPSWPSPWPRSPPTGSGARLRSCFRRPTTPRSSCTPAWRRRAASAWVLRPAFTFTTRDPASSTRRPRSTSSSARTRPRWPGPRSPGTSWPSPPSCAAPAASCRARARCWPLSCFACCSRRRGSAGCSPRGTRTWACCPSGSPSWPQPASRPARAAPSRSSCSPAAWRSRATWSSLSPSRSSPPRASPWRPFRGCAGASACRPCSPASARDRFSRPWPCSCCCGRCPSSTSSSATTATCSVSWRRREGAGRPTRGRRPSRPRRAPSRASPPAFSARHPLHARSSPPRSWPWPWRGPAGARHDARSLPEHSPW